MPEQKTKGTKGTQAENPLPASKFIPAKRGGFIPKHGGYERLLAYQKALVVYDATVNFYDRFIDKKSRTHDQMVQAARSGKQNILEGSEASGTSKEAELKLTGVAKASQKELLEDYRDFIAKARHSGMDCHSPVRPAIATPKSNARRELRNLSEGDRAYDPRSFGPPRQTTAAMSVQSLRL